VVQNLRLGQIVWAEVPDDYGNKPTRHPVIITSPDEEIPSLSMLAGITCSHSAAFKKPRPDCWVALPFQPEGRCSTKLRRETVAIPTWRVAIPATGYGPNDIGGFVRQALLLNIVRIADEISSQGCVPTVSCQANTCKPPTSEFSATTQP
jgi:hypothetical protein